MRYIVLVAVLTWIYSEGAGAKEFRCFKCESNSTGMCADGFHPTGIQVEDCKGSCVKEIHHFDIVDLKSHGYSRYCMTTRVPEGCTTTDKYHTGGKVHIERTTCHCNTDICNSQPANCYSLLTTYLVTVLLLFT